MKLARPFQFLGELILVEVRLHGPRSESLNVAEFSALGVTTPNFMVNVFDLDHEGFDGLLGMNFLRHFNFEVRPVDQ